ncbi:ParB family chromosome partitioning protein [Arcanobacterium wilhelmae]|uniref:ParB family chromosome partitioning protein n=1 Tax=Arcanobacterium wilhelmae TaxID=1803177 RepID=A0ABT9NB07_9ACTO|nr:ParB/RepB/Spo0J family partition protein [Arcanobacterium wilhelmae]MDP9800904.1 ParB family chromosome partitioning protein [Arcanobacterium wilhelmae]WFN90270.1 ParB/RepB/Spo0J family partition protein [Arcanobacterium wilhelmae]
MAEKRRGLGVGLGSLIPNNQQEKKNRPIDVFFSGSNVKPDTEADSSASSATDVDSGTVPAELGGEKTHRSRQSVSKKSGGKKTTTVDKASSKITTSQVVSGAELANEQGSGQSDTPSARTNAESGKPNELSTVSGAPAAKAAKGAPDANTEGAVQMSDPSVSETADDNLLPIPGTTYGEIDVTWIVPNRAQPRTIFDEDDLQELADSIKEVGVLQPIVVRPLSEPDRDHPDARYELIMGERRWRATQRAGLKEVPAIVRHTQDNDLLRDALLENLHRAQLNPLEEAAAYQQLLEDFGCTQEELSRKIARSRPQISNTLRLMKLPPLVQRRVAAGVLSAGHARALLGLTDPAAMERLAQRIVAEGLSVRAVEEIVAMGEEGAAAARRRPRISQFPDELGALATRLADRLNTRVKVNMGQRKGKISIDFGSLDDLNRILSELGDGGVEFPVQHEESAG